MNGKFSINSPLKGIFNTDSLKENPKLWHFKVLPTDLLLCSDVKKSPYVYVIAKGALQCSSNIDVSNFPVIISDTLSCLGYHAGSKINITLDTFLRGQCIGLSTIQDTVDTSKLNSDFYGFDDESTHRCLVLDKYPVQIKTWNQSETEVLMISKQLRPSFDHKQTCIFDFF